MIKEKNKALVLSGLFVALGLVIPTFFHWFNMAGPIFLPMHIPVLLCGLLCGWQFGLLCGMITPLLSSLLTSMPPLYPMGVVMILELGTYGLVAGFLSKKTNTIFALIGAMLCGRVVNGLASTVFMGMLGKGYSLQAFLTGSFVTALPGIIVQIIAIPLIITAVKRFAK